MTKDETIETLLWLSHEIGREDRHFSILGEGNTSALTGDDTFWIKASGGSLGTLQADGLTEVRMEKVLAALDDPGVDDSGVRDVLLASRVKPESKLPSVETFMHAVCYAEAGAKWVGHCHTVSVLQILCSKLGVEPFLKHVFPDVIVVCGRNVATVPYIDPGLELARAFRASLRQFMAEHGVPPKVVLLGNHGPVAIGPTARDVLNILLMLDKWARVLLGTYSLGGPQYLPDSTSLRIDSRPDEHYRRAQISALQK